jgi:hypothetical protein
MNFTPGQKEQIIERRKLLMEQRLKFKSLDEIHQWWNATYPDQPLARSTIGKDIQAVIDQSIKETGLAALQWRELHIQRIEAVLANEKFQAKLQAGDLFAIDRFDKLMNRLILLTGANAPTKITQTDVTGEKNVSNLTDDERLRLIHEIMDSARERKLLEESITVVDSPIVETDDG